MATDVFIYVYIYIYTHTQHKLKAARAGRRSEAESVAGRERERERERDRGRERERERERDNYPEIARRHSRGDNNIDAGTNVIRTCLAKPSQARLSGLTSHHAASQLTHRLYVHTVHTCYTCLKHQTSLIRPTHVVMTPHK